MKVTFSGIAIVDGTGKIGGNTIQGSRFGKIARVNVRPTIVNAANFNANNEKALFRQIVSRWRSLTPTQRVSWTPLIPTGLSGFNIYTSVNLLFYRINGSFQDTAPIARVAPILDTFAFSATHVLNKYTISFNCVSTLANMTANFFLSINNSTGVLTPRQSSFRLATNELIAAGANTWTLTLPSQFVNQIAGSQTFMKFVIVDSVSGIAYSPSYFSAIVT